MSCWPDELQPGFEQVDVAIARTHPEMADQVAVHEIKILFLTQIAAADWFLYCESQFASRRIAEAIARRLSKPDGPQIIIINPEAAEGWLQPLAMDTARARLIAALRQRDRRGRLAEISRCLDRSIFVQLLDFEREILKRWQPAAGSTDAAPCDQDQTLARIAPDWPFARPSRRLSESKSALTALVS